MHTKQMRVSRFSASRMRKSATLASLLLLLLCDMPGTSQSPGGAKQTLPDGPSPRVGTLPSLAAPAVPQDVTLLIGAGQFAAAASRLQALLQTDPNNADAFFLLGYALYRQTRFTESLAAYTAGARLRSPSIDELVVVASDYIQLRAYTDAARWLRYAADHAPQNAGVWYLLGRTEYLQDRQEGALAAFQRCLLLRPRDVRARYNAGLALERLQRPAEAEAAYREAIEWATAQHSLDPQPWLDLGDLLLAQGKPHEAAETLAQAVLKAPANAFCQQQLGVALQAEGKNEAALVPLQRAATLAPKAERVHFFLARTYKALGRKTEAAAEFAEVERLFQTHESAETPNPDLPSPSIGGEKNQKDD